MQCLETKEINFFILVIIIAMTFKYSLTWMRHYLKYMLPPVYKNATCNALSVRILMYFSHKRNLDGQSFYFLIKSVESNSITARSSTYHILSSKPTWLALNPFFPTTQSPHLCLLPNNLSSHTGYKNNSLT